jgi:hypothetical protein
LACRSQSRFIEPGGLAVANPEGVGNFSQRDVLGTSENQALQERRRKEESPATESACEQDRLLGGWELRGPVAPASPSTIVACGSEEGEREEVMSENQVKQWVWRTGEEGEEKEELRGSDGHLKRASGFKLLSG